MKGTKSILQFSLFSLFFVFAFSSTVEAQWGEKLLNRAIDKTTRQAEKRVNRATDKAIKGTMDKAEDGATDAVTGKSRKEKAAEREAASDSDFLSEAADEDYVYNSDFVGMFTMEYEFYEGGIKKENPMIGTYYFNRNKLCMEVQSTENVTVIVDHDANSMMMVNPDQKSVIKLKKPTKTSSNDDQEYTVTRQGDKKFVLGHQCVKYIVDSEDSKSTIWVDESIRFDYAQSMRGFVMGGKKKVSDGSELMSQIGGFPIEIETKNKKNDHSVVMRTTSVEVGKVDENVFNLDGYSIQDMSGY